LINYLLPIDQPLEQRKNKPYSIYKKTPSIKQEINQEIINNNKDPKNIKINWDRIIGYEGIKDTIQKALKNKNIKKTHILLVGSAGTSKTIFLKTIEDNLKDQSYNVHYLDSTTLTSSGVIEYMFNHDIDYLLLDELDKLLKEHQATFLNLLESGILQETKFKRIRKKDMSNTIAICTGNYIDKIMDPLKTRFLVLNIPKYTKDQFYEISTKLLTTQYDKTKEISFYITDQIWKIFTTKRQEDPNMRQCVQVAVLTDNTKESIDPVLQTIEKYSLKVDE
jgi:ATP-dependent Lon protease